MRIEGGSEAVLIALPDERGRVAIHQGSARVVVSADRVIALEPGQKVGGRSQPVEARKPARLNPSADENAAARCDLRGLRVVEALDALDETLDHALAAGRRTLVVLHGIGTGALRRAVREHLQTSPYVASFENAESGEGGDGATVARLC